jgi:hypothetical protein
MGANRDSAAPWWWDLDPLPNLPEIIYVIGIVTLFQSPCEVREVTSSPTYCRIFPWLRLDGTQLSLAVWLLLPAVHLSYNQMCPLIYPGTWKGKRKSQVLSSSLSKKQPNIWLVLGDTLSPTLLTVPLRVSRGEKLNNSVESHAKRLDHVEDRLSEPEDKVEEWEDSDTDTRKIMKAIYDKCIWQCIHGEKLKSPPLNSGTRKRYPLSPFLFCIVLEFLARAMIQEKEIKRIQIENEEVTWYDPIIKRPKHSTKKFIHLINIFRKVTG